MSVLANLGLIAGGVGHSLGSVADFAGDLFDNDDAARQGKVAKAAYKYSAGYGTEKETPVQRRRRGYFVRDLLTRIDPEFNKETDPDAALTTFQQINADPAKSEQVIKLLLNPKSLKMLEELYGERGGIEFQNYAVERGLGFDDSEDLAMKARRKSQNYAEEKGHFEGGDIDESISDTDTRQAAVSYGMDAATFMVPFAAPARILKGAKAASSAARIGKRAAHGVLPGLTRGQRIVRGAERTARKIDPTQSGKALAAEAVVGAGAGANAELDVLPNEVAGVQLSQPPNPDDPAGAFESAGSRAGGGYVAAGVVPLAEGAVRIVPRALKGLGDTIVRSATGGRVGGMKDMAGGSIRNLTPKQREEVVDRAQDIRPRGGDKVAGGGSVVLPQERSTLKEKDFMNADDYTAHKRGAEVIDANLEAKRAAEISDKRRPTDQNIRDTAWKTRQESGEFYNKQYSKFFDDLPDEVRNSEVEVTIPAIERESLGYLQSALKSEDEGKLVFDPKLKSALDRFISKGEAGDLTLTATPRQLHQLHSVLRKAVSAMPEGPAQNALNTRKQEVKAALNDILEDYAGDLQNLNKEYRRNHARSHYTDLAKGLRSGWDDTQLKTLEKMAESPDEAHDAMRALSPIRADGSPNIEVGRARYEKIMDSYLAREMAIRGNGRAITKITQSILRGGGESVPWKILSSMSDGGKKYFFSRLGRDARAEGISARDYYRILTKTDKDGKRDRLAALYEKTYKRDNFEAAKRLVERGDLLTGGMFIQTFQEQASKTYGPISFVVKHGSRWARWLSYHLVNPQMRAVHQGAEFGRATLAGIPHRQTRGIERALNNWLISDPKDYEIILDALEGKLPTDKKSQVRLSAAMRRMSDDVFGRPPQDWFSGGAGVRRAIIGGGQQAATAQPTEEQ